MAYPKLVNEIVKKLDEHKAEDIAVVNVSSRTPFADYYIMATCPNTRALGSIADYIQEQIELTKEPVRKVEGTPNSGWVIVDAGSVVVHLFEDYKRREVDLDSLISKSK